MLTPWREGLLLCFFDMDRFIGTKICHYLFCMQKIRNVILKLQIPF